MRFLKQFTIIITLLITTACGSSSIEDKTILSLPGMTHTLIHKDTPKWVLIQALSDIDVQAKSVILINADNNNILYDENIHQSLPVASMSKIMTELLVLEAIKEGRLDWQDSVFISDYAFTFSNKPGFASVKLEQNKQYTIRELFHAMAIQSANGATIALAEAVSGSEKNFVVLMNEKAKLLGLQNTQFVNSTGLSNNDLDGFHSTGSIDDTNKMSASDLAVLASYVIDQHPDILKIVNLLEFEFQDETFKNSNWMLPNTNIDYINEDVTFEGVDGLKTGFTEIAGYCFTGTVKINDTRFVSVVIGTPNLEDRFLETKKLYDAVAGQLNME